MSCSLHHYLHVLSPRSNLPSSLPAWLIARYLSVGVGGKLGHETAEDPPHPTLPNGKI